MTDFEEILMILNTKDIKPIEIKSLFLLFLEVNKFNKVNTSVLKGNILAHKEFKDYNFKFNYCLMNKQFDIDSEGVTLEYNEMNKTLSFEDFFNHINTADTKIDFEMIKKHSKRTKLKKDIRFFASDKFEIKGVTIDNYRLFHCKLYLDEVQSILKYVLKRLIRIEKVTDCNKSKIEYFRKVLQVYNYEKIAVKGYSGQFVLTDYLVTEEEKIYLLISAHRQNYDWSNEYEDKYEISIEDFEKNLLKLLERPYNEKAQFGLKLIANK